MLCFLVGLPAPITIKKFLFQKLYTEEARKKNHLYNFHANVYIFASSTMYTWQYKQVLRKEHGSETSRPFIYVL